jgi:hypothetical protein
VNLISPGSAGEFMVYDSVVEGFRKAKGLLGIEPDPIPVVWPSSDNGTYYAPGEGIFVERYDRGDRDVILHEYGHYVADLNGFALFRRSEPDPLLERGPSLYPYNSYRRGDERVPGGLGHPVRYRRTVWRYRLPLRGRRKLPGHG